MVVYIGNILANPQWKSTNDKTLSYNNSILIVPSKMAAINSVILQVADILLQFFLL